MDGLAAAVTAEFDACVDVRRTVHRRPELAFEEHETTALIRNQLTASGLRSLPCPTETGAVFALEGGRPGRTVLLRADIDALPVDEEVDVVWRSEIDGQMHACGHDGHVAILLSVARLLSRRAEDIPGRYVFLFQPAEERGGGAQRMIDGGVLNNLGVDHIVGLHLASTFASGLVGLRAGVAMAATQPFRVLLNGTGGHGALAGDEGNVLAAVATLSRVLDEVVKDMEYQDVSCVCGAGVLHAGTAANVVPRTALLEGTLRTFTDLQRGDALLRLRERCDAIGADFGVQTTLQLGDDGCRPVTNDAATTATVLRALTAQMGQRAVVEIPPMTPSDDVSEFMHRIPGCYFFVGAAPGTKRPPMHHAPDFTIDEEALRVGMRSLASAAIGLAEP